MSEDALYVIRDRGVDRMFHSKWGATHIDALLLRNGPSELVVKLHGYPEWRYGLDAAWLSGYVLVDLDRRLLLYWMHQFRFSGPHLLRCFGLLLAREWVGWTTRWATRPACDLGEALGGDYHDRIDGRENARATCTTVGECAHLLVALDWLPELGEEVWLTVRDRAGDLRDYRFEFQGNGHVLDLGPVLLDHLATQAPQAPENDHADQTLFVDVPARRLVAWRLAGRFIENAYHAERFWPGWSVAFHDGGPRLHWAYSGRADEESEIGGGASRPANRRFEHLCHAYRRCGGDALDPAVVRALPEIAAQAERGARDAVEALSGRKRPPLVQSGLADRLDDPIGETVCDGAYLITRTRSGVASRGLFGGMDVSSGAGVLITICERQRRRPAELQVALAHDGVPGVAPLLAFGRVDGRPDLDVLVEEEPPGAPLAVQWTEPLPVASVVTVATALEQTLAAAHARGTTIGSLRPELIYVTRPTFTELVPTAVAPRAEVFLRSGETRGTSPIVFEDAYLSLELIRGEREAPVSDVYVLCLVLAWLATGKFPFAGDGVVAQAIAMAQGKRTPWTADPKLGQILDGGLALDPARRTPLSLLAAQLRRLSD